MGSPSFATTLSKIPMGTAADLPVKYCKLTQCRYCTCRDHNLISILYQSTESKNLLILLPVTETEVLRLSENLLIKLETDF